MVIKFCNKCGLGHPVVPTNARKWVQDGKLIGYFWECKCGSTMFKKEEEK